jgi:serine/threonine protein kinase/formylglycine-generating enzyme required for sulfatase activity
MNPPQAPDPTPPLPPDKLSAAEAAGLFDVACQPRDETGHGEITDDNPLQATGMERAGDVIDRYTLVRCLGIGGCGAVWLAEQTQPLQRQVALKILKAGMDTREFIARFEQERQALALMDHPHIAKIFDAGSTAIGRPYFVMEYVPGEPLDGYCDRRQLDVIARLRLFRQVCLAVQHAHDKGVIHRDLKPSNLLVREQDGEPYPQVIDFGVAKAAGANLTDITVHTRIEQALGTPGYMSPEQLDPRLGRPDGRSDVFSLGAVLYELLTGTPPLDNDEFAQAAFAAVLRRVREDDPPPPSRRVTSLAAARRTEVARQRGIPVQHLPGILRGELDWLVMRCLEKDPRHRYQTATELADDLQRYLRDGSVLARPAPWTRKAWRTVSRNRLAAGAVVVGMLALGFAVTVLVENHQLRFGIRKLRHLPSQEPFKNSLGMEFLPVTLACDTVADEGGLAEAWFSVHETRRGEFATFLRDPETRHDMSVPNGVPPNYQAPEINWEHPGFAQTDAHPVVCVSWDDADAFCQWLTRKERHEKIIGPRDFYRLPTDREWSTAIGLRHEIGETPSERAVIAQTVFDEHGDGFPWGSAWPPPAGSGNFAADQIAGYQDTHPYTAPAGSFRPGEFGLHDLAGNVTEWCLEPANAATTPYDYMTARGASWQTCDRADLAASSRDTALPKRWRYPFVGFRCVLVRFKDGVNLLPNAAADSWIPLVGRWRIAEGRLSQTDNTPDLGDWLMWRTPELPRNWLLEFLAQPEVASPADWEACCKGMRIAYRFVSPDDYTAVLVGHRGVQIVRHFPGNESRILARLAGGVDHDMGKGPVAYAIEASDDWIRVYRKGVLVLETRDPERRGGALAFEWFNVKGTFHGLRLRER